ncbi:MAG: ATP-binding protein, partial [Ignavibacteria bacterium]
MNSEKEISLIMEMDNITSILLKATSIKNLKSEAGTIINSILKAGTFGLFLFDKKKQQILEVFEENESTRDLINFNSDLAEAFNTGKIIETKDAPASLYIPFEYNDDTSGVLSLHSTGSSITENQIKKLLFTAKIAIMVWQNIISLNKRLETEENLRLYDRALMANRNGIIITDYRQTDNPIIFVNHAFENITGYKAEEVIGSNLSFLQKYDNDKRSLEALRTAIKEEKESTIILEDIRKSGEVLYNELTVSPMQDEKGITTHYICIQNDITQRVKFENQLKEASIRIGSLVLNMQSGILIEDENRRIVITNKEFCVTFGIPFEPEDMVGFDCSQSAEQTKSLFAEPEEFVRRITEILNDRKLVKGEELWLQDGRILERDYIPIFISTIYRGHFWQYRDITLRKTHEEEIKRLKQFYQQILNDLPGQVAVYNKEFQYIFVNPASIQDAVLREWVIGRDDSDLCKRRGYDPAIAEQRKDNLKLAMTSKKPFSFDEIITNKNEDPKYYYRTISPIIDSNGEVTRLLGYGLEITELKIAQEELMKAKLLAEESTKAKGLFLANMSHEIRTPMNAILGFSEILKRRLDDEVSHSYLSAIMRSGQSLLSLINDILDLSKIEAGKVEIKNEPANLFSLFNEIKMIYSVILNDKGVSFNVDIDPSMPTGLLIDEFRLKQVILNLVSNAIKFTASGSVNIIVTAEINELCKLTVEVRDTGIGIPKEQHDKIFESFTQQKGQSTSKYGGTGLGLTISKKLVELMGGRIVLESNPGEGTSFRVIISDIEIIENNDTDILESIEDYDSIVFEKAKVLIVEDTETNIRVLSEFLKMENIETIEASDGMEAIAKAERTRPDLILMDIQMPVMDGWEMLDIINKSQ